MSSFTAQHWTLLHALQVEDGTEGLCHGNVWTDLVAEGLAGKGRISVLGKNVVRELEEHLASGGTYLNYHSSYTPLVSR